MELAIFKNGIENQNRLIDSALEKDGLFFKREDSYSYTVGMNRYELPDVVCFLPQDEAEELILLILKAHQLGLTSIVGGKKIINLIDPEPQVIELAEADKRLIFYANRAYYRSWEFKAITLKLDS